MIRRLAVLAAALLLVVVSAGAAGAGQSVSPTLTGVGGSCLDASGVTVGSVTAVRVQDAGPLYPLGRTVQRSATTFVVDCALTGGGSEVGVAQLVNALPLAPSPISCAAGTVTYPLTIPQSVPLPGGSVVASVSLTGLASSYSFVYSADDAAEATLVCDAAAAFDRARKSADKAAVLADISGQLR